jgi:hypothetical protein
MPRHVVVALVRVDGRGRPMRIVTRGALTSGRFTARLPARAGARYALRLEVGGGLRVFAELPPGAHGLVKTVEGSDEELTLYAPFEVLAPSAR